ncbi:MAG: hypothetical protein AAGU32_14965, partial [Bacillota bacterium]
MATYDGSIRINSKIDSSGATKGATAINAALALIEGNAAKAGAALAAAFAPAIIVTAILTVVAKLGELGGKAIEVASDLDEVQNVVDVTFGSMAGSVNEFAQSSLKSFGLSQLAAKQYSSTIGAMLKSMGFATDQAAEMSTTIAGLAGDIASFYNLDPGTAFEKLRSGISGETEPLKQLGINLSQANLEAYAMSQGIKTAYSSMSEMQKATLRYNYILSVTSDAQGDFARTSNSWANQTRLLNEQWSELLGMIGPFLTQVLLPALQYLNNLLSNIIATLRKLGLGTQNISSTASDAAESQNDLADGIAAAGKAANNALASFDELETRQKGLGGASVGFDSSGLDDLKTALTDTLGADDTGNGLDLKLVVTPDWRDWGDPPISSPVLVPVEPDLSEYPATEEAWRDILTPLPTPVYIPHWGLLESFLPETEGVLAESENMWDGLVSAAAVGAAALGFKLADASKSFEDLQENGSLNTDILRGNVVQNMTQMAIGSIIASGLFASGVSKNVHDTAENSIENTNKMYQSMYASEVAFIPPSLDALTSWGNGVIEIGVQTIKGFGIPILDGLQSIWESIVSVAKATGQAVKG